MSTWYEQATFYHIYPLGLTGAPKHNLEPPSINRFEELNRFIPHMKDMGFTALYIGPLFESSTHGYDTIDYRRVDRRLGDNESFKGFVKACHEQGIRVVVDGVFNHTGREFFAFKDLLANRENSPYCGWYKGLWFDASSPFNDPFVYESWQGHAELPVLNLDNYETRQYLFETVRYWVTEFDIDGIRLDCANVLSFAFMQELRTISAELKPDFWLMGEVIHGDYSRWVSPGMLHSVTNYELHKSLYSGLNDHNFFEIAHNVRRLLAVGRQLYTFLDNHDENRIASKLKKNAHLPLAYLLLFTLPGIPSVYYGGEWALKGVRSGFSDDPLRPAISAAEIPEKAIPLTGQIKTLAQIRARCPELHQGLYKELLLANRQYAFARILENSFLIIAVNGDDQEATLHIPLPGSKRIAINLLDQTSLPVSAEKLTVVLPPNQGAIYQILEGGHDTPKPIES